MVKMVNDSLSGLLICKKNTLNWDQIINDVENSRASYSSYFEDIRQI